MSSKYAALYEYVGSRYASVIVLTFGQIEDLIGFALPDLARTQREWWTAADANAQSEPSAGAFALAGRIATPNLPARTVKFERI